MVLFILIVIALILLAIVLGSQKILGVFEISSETIKTYAKKKFNSYSENLYKLSILEKILHKVENEFGTVLFDVIEEKPDKENAETELYLVFPLKAICTTGLKLDVCVKGDKIGLCIKRSDNGTIAEDDGIDKFLKTKAKGKNDGDCYRIKNGRGSDLFEIEEGCKKIIELLE